MKYYKKKLKKKKRDRINNIFRELSENTCVTLQQTNLLSLLDNLTLNQKKLNVFINFWK